MNKERRVDIEMMKVKLFSMFFDRIENDNDDGIISIIIIVIIINIQTWWNMKSKCAYIYHVWERKRKLWIELNIEYYWFIIIIIINDIILYMNFLY